MKAFANNLFTNGGVFGDTLSDDHKTLATQLYNNTEPAFKIASLSIYNAFIANTTVASYITQGTSIYFIDSGIFKLTGVTPDLLYNIGDIPYVVATGDGVVGVAVFATLSATDIFDGKHFSIKIGTTNTVNTYHLSLNGTSKAVYDQQGSAAAIGLLITGNIYDFVYNTTLNGFQIIGLVNP